MDEKQTDGPVVEANDNLVTNKQANLEVKSKSNKSKIYVAAAVLVIFTVGIIVVLLARNPSGTSDEPLVTSSNKQQEQDDNGITNNSDRYATYQYKGRLYLYDKNTNQNEIIVQYSDEYSPEQDRVRQVFIDPTGNYILFTHSNEQDGSINKFSYYKMALSLYDIKNKMTKPIIEEREKSVTHINWSPNGSRFSLVLNNGESAEIWSVSEGRLQVITPENIVGPVIWVDDERISYISGSTLFIGTEDESNKEVIAENANVAVPGFEGPGTLQTPFWSGDKVVYQTLSEELVILDTTDGKVVVLGTFVNEVCLDDCPESDNITASGWLDSDNFLYSKEQIPGLYNVTTGEFADSLSKNRIEDISVSRKLTAERISEGEKTLLKMSSITNNGLVDDCSIDITTDTSNTTAGFRNDAYSSISMSENGLVVASKIINYSRLAFNDPEPPEREITFVVIDGSNCKQLDTIKP